MLLCPHRGNVSTHSRPKAAAKANEKNGDKSEFQHTAARRRLRYLIPVKYEVYCFNTQPPEGGCFPCV